MRAFTIHHLYECKITGAVMAEYSFTLNEGLTVGHKPFTSMELATSYLHKSKRDWILNAVELFVRHKEHIINSWHDTNKNHSLELCKQGNAKYPEMGLKQICTAILKGKNHFNNILPLTGNPSFESSANNLAEIIRFCENETK